MEIEYKAQSHEMIIEGTSNIEPFACDIADAVKDEGYELHNLEIWFDALQNIWKFHGDIK